MAAPNFLFAFLCSILSLSAATDCHYSIHGTKLLWNGDVVSRPNGVRWLVDKSADNDQLELSFERPVSVYSVSMQLRSNRVVRIKSFDVDNELMPAVLHVGAGRLFPLQTKLDEPPTVSKLAFLGLNAPMSAQEIGKVDVIACPAECDEPGACFGTCKYAVQKGCMVCSCPKGEISSGCNGYVRDKDLHLLLELVRRKVRGCQSVQGYRRQVDKSARIDRCVPFNYPKCRFFKDVVVPRTEGECLRHCY